MYNCRVCGAPEYDLDNLVMIGDKPKAVQYLPIDIEEAINATTILDVRQCKYCGVIQLVNDPVPYYKEVIRSSGISQSLKDRQHDAFADFILYFDLMGKRVLEIGSGKGEYLGILEDCGVNPWGLPGYPVELAEEDPFDAFISINFLEHTPNPIDFLTKSANLITIDGVGMISVPDFEVELWDNALFTFMSDHLLYFSKDSLHNTLSLSGYDILRLFRNNDLNVLTAYVRKRKKKDLTIPIKKQNDINDFLMEYVKYTGRVVIWGASHLAFSMIPIISHKIVYFVDSAPFKQDKFVPVTGHKIYPPQHLNEDPIDTVIVMCPEYSTEIVNEIETKYPQVKRIATFINGKLGIVK